MGGKGINVYVTEQRAREEEKLGLQRILGIALNNAKHERCRAGAEAVKPLAQMHYNIMTLGFIFRA